MNGANQIISGNVLINLFNMKNLQLIIIFTILSFSLKAQTSHGICDSLFLSNTTFFLTNTDSVFQFSFNYLSSLGVGYGIYRFSFDDTTYVGTTYHSSRNLQDVIRICGTQKGFKSDKAVIDFLVYFIIRRILCQTITL